MFGWSYLDEAGEELGVSQHFPDVESAEEWMSASWKDLLDHGVESVALHDHVRGRWVYRMGLGSEYLDGADGRHPVDRPLSRSDPAS
jgi:hypothetical protein